MRSTHIIIMLLSIFAYAKVAQLQKSSNTVSCKDEHGKDVDWWYMYKLPKHYENKEANQQGSGQGVKADTTGLRYFYVTSDSYDDWQFSDQKISDSDSLTAQTLNPIYADQRVLLVAYNDQYPNDTVKDNGGHAKGVVATDGTTGIWLVHSVPKFPTIPHYEYPSTGERYAQSLLCLTLDAANIDKVGQVLVYNEPHFYYERVPLLIAEDGANARFPSLDRALRRQWRTTPPFHEVVELPTLGGKKFKVFGKSGRAQEELYADLVAPTLDATLLVESWRNGAGNLPNSCALDDKVLNIDEIKSPDLHIEFKTTSDHSKWAVTQETGVKVYRWRIGGADWTCIGDINRQQTQLNRGGGTVCHKSSRIAHLYRKLVAKYDVCA